MAENKYATRPLPNLTDETVYAGNEDTAWIGESDATVYAGAAQEMVYTEEQKAESLAEAEKNVAINWNVGDNILDLYEVLPVNDDGKAFHEGGFGKVYKVHHKTWNTDLAVKAPHAHVFATEAQKQNFISECQAWIELGMHPNIATCYYVRDLGGVPRIFAEYVSGGSLKEWIQSERLYNGDKKTVLKRILNIAIQFAWGLHYAHEKGMIHQDVKPHNVMMTDDGEVKVVDFGLARAKAAGEVMNEYAQQSVMMTSAGGYTPAYCSPEQMGRQRLTRRTDMWSWGVSVLEMFAGEATWQSGVIAAYALEAFLEHNGEEENKPAMPDDVVQLLKKCFAENEAERPHTMMYAAEKLILVYETECGENFLFKWTEGASDTADALNNRALSYLDLRYEDKAEMLWNIALRIDPNHVESIYNRGLMLWRKGHITDGKLVSQIEHARTSHKDSWIDEYLLGLVHIERSDAESAIALLEQAEKQSGGSTDVLSALEKAKAGKDIWNKLLKTLDGHTGAVTSVAISTDVRYALSGSDGILGDGNTLMLWDISTGKWVHNFKEYSEDVTSVALSADGCFALSGGRDNILRLLDVSTGECLQKYTGHEGWISSAALNMDCNVALSASEFGLKLWDIWTGKCLKSFEGHTDAVEAVAISADGRMALSGSRDATIRLWDIRTGACMRIFKGHGTWVNAVAFSGNGNYTLSGSGSMHGNDNTLKLWDISTGECLRTFEGHMNMVNTAVFIPKSQLALSGSGGMLRTEDCTLKLWNIATGQCLHTFEGHTRRVTSVAISPDGRSALSGSSDETLKFWRIGSSEFTASWYLCKPESSMVVIKRESEFETYINQAEKKRKHGDFSGAAALLRQAKSLPGCERLKEMRDAWASLYTIWPKKHWESSWEIQRFEGHTKAVNAVAISADGRFALSGSGDNTLKLWDIEEGTCLRTFEGNTAKVESVALSADGRFAVSGGRDNNVKVWDTQTGKCLKTFEAHHSVKVAAFSPDRLALSGSFLGLSDTLKLWDISTGNCLPNFKEHTRSVRSAVFSADGRFVLSGSWDNTLKLWDIQEDKCVRSFKGHSHSVTTVSISANGRFALSGSSDNTMKFWDIAEGVCLRTFENVCVHDYGKDATKVESVALSADGRFAVSGAWDHNVKLWDTETGKCLRIFEGHTDFVTAVDISADGRYILSGSLDNTMHLWELTWEVEDRSQADWDDGAEPYLKNFLSLHQPVSHDNPLIYKGVPTWTEQDFEQLIVELGYRGYGWLRPEGVRAKLEEMQKAY